MQTLFIPDKIQIDFLDSENNSLKQEKNLIGIRIFANHKNDIDLSPFLTDKNGTIIITAQDIREKFDNYISYGIMDYSSLETAKPKIEIYYWGNKKITKHISNLKNLLKGKKYLKQYEMWGEKLGKQDKEAAEIERKERKELEFFETCHNRETKISSDKTIIKDTWDNPVNELNYKVKI